MKDAPPDGIASWRQVLALLALTLPWLNPLAAGPSPAVQPWLVTLACLALLLLILPWRHWLDPRLLAGSWAAAALLSTLIALCQYLDLAQHFTPWMNLSPEHQAYANLRQRNQYASLCMIGLATLLYLGRATPATARVQPALLAGAFWLGLGAAISASRTGLLQWLSLAVLGLLWHWWAQPVARRLLLASALGYGFGALVLPLVLGQDPTGSGILSRFDAPSCNSRLVLWRNVLELIAQRPWLGWGWGELDYAHFMHLYAGPRFCEILGNAHNLPLHLAVELGLPLALLFCSVLAWRVLRLRPWRETHPVRQLAWGVLALLGLHSLLEFPLWYGPFLLTLILALGLLSPFSAPPRQPGTRPGSASLALAGVLLLGLAYVAWDYRRIGQIYLEPSQRAAFYREHTLDKIRPSWLFRSQVEFSELVLTPVTHGNARHVHDLALTVLHYSPEARVVERLIDSALLLGHEEEARRFIARYQVAYPQDYQRWRAQEGDRQPE